MPDTDRPNARLALADTEEQARAYPAPGQLVRRNGDYPETEEQLDATAQLIDSIHDVLQRASLQLQLGYSHYDHGR